MATWKSIVTAPKDGTLILIRDQTNDLLTPCFWDGRRWRLWNHGEYKIGINTTEWAPYPE
jgi:hypothetical protein